MNDTPTIKIKCPKCGAILTVADSPANIGKSVKCPVCKEKNMFTLFKPVKAKEEDSFRTQLNLNLFSNDKTQLPQAARSVSCGYILHDGHNRKYDLAFGLNLIGRKVYQTESPATIPIETDDMGFSRRHIYIEVIKGPDGVIRHYAYNASNKNETTINGIRLESGDKLILHDSDIIHSANTTLIFKFNESGFHFNTDYSDKTEI